jgi:elongation factor P
LTGFLCPAKFSDPVCGSGRTNGDGSARISQANSATISRNSKHMRASDIRKGQAVKIDGKLYVVTNADHNTPGNLRAKVQFKLRDVLKGTIQDKRVGATDDIETTTLDARTVEYLYSDNEGHILMDLETFDQQTIPKDVFGDDILYLKPNTQLTAHYHEGKIVTYDLPKVVDLLVTDTMPAIKGATATNQLKEATLETGLKTRVPGFILNGETIRISTENGGYMSRA